MQRILIVEDDRTIANLIQSQLNSWGFEAHCIQKFNDVLEEFKQVDPQLVLMDITLPFYNGYHWCTEIRRTSTVPILFISSASDNMNIVMAMNMGGDDFIAKPFDFNVLIAKIQAILRRSYGFKENPASLNAKGAALNLYDATLSYQDKRIDLTRNEYRMLKILMENQGKIVSREAMMQSLWQTDEFIDDNTLTVNITRLRKKLEEAGLCDFIKTKKGIGYLIE